MKSKLLLILLAAAIVGLAAWVVRGPGPAQADEVPEKYRDTVRKGLEYLAKNQAKDGHWEGDDGKHPVAITGLVGLALLMEVPRKGLTPRPAKYEANIRKAADWLMDKSQGRDGLIFSGHDSERSRYMEGHGLATLFLAGSCGPTDEARRKKLDDVLTRAVKYIAKAQSTQGGWHHTSKVEGHDLDEVAATAIQIQALRAAENLGIPIPDGVITAAQDYLFSKLERYEKTKPKRDAGRTAEIAAALACLVSQNSGSFRGEGETKDEPLKKWLKYCQSEIPVGRDMRLGRDDLIHYYYAQVVFEADHGNWDRYRTAMFDQLQRTQYEDGSWFAGDGIGVGQVYSTALWCVVLQLDNWSHPSRRRLEMRR
jgi:hypothetical protein